jgi:hypothetical protein
MTEARYRRPPRVFATLIVLVAIGFLYGGAKLVAVGGSWYYLLSGIVLAACGALFWLRKRSGAHLYGAFLAATFVWALFEAGTDLWALVPRLGVPILLGAWLLTPIARRSLFYPDPPPALLADRTTRIIGGVAVVAVAIVIALGSYSPVSELPPRYSAQPRAVRVTGPSTRSRRRMQESCRNFGTTVRDVPGSSKRRRCRSASCSTSARQ